MRMDINSFPIYDEWKVEKVMTGIRWHLTLPGDVERQRKVEILLEFVHQSVSIGKLDVERLGLGLI